MTQPTTERPRAPINGGTDDEPATLCIDGDVFETLSVRKDAEQDGNARRVDRWLETWSRGLP